MGVAMLRGEGPHMRGEWTRDTFGRGPENGFPTSLWATLEVKTAQKQVKRVVAAKPGHPLESPGKHQTLLKPVSLPKASPPLSRAPGTFKAPRVLLMFRQV